MKGLLCLSSCIFAFALSGLIHAAPGDIFAEIIAPSDTATGWVSEGHAFLCLSLETGSGVQEGCFGFYNTSRPGQVFIGSPELSGFFQKNTVKDPKAPWSLRRKITEGRQREFLNLVTRVNSGGAGLLAARLGDFIAEVAGLFAWKTPGKPASPQAYVRELYLANLTGFDYTGGAFKRTPVGWEEIKSGKSDKAPKKGKGDPPGIHTYKEVSHDDTWLFLKDPDRSMDVRLPLHQGMAQWQNKTDWVSLFQVTPKVE